MKNIILCLFLFSLNLHAAVLISQKDAFQNFVKQSFGQSPDTIKANLIAFENQHAVLMHQVVYPKHRPDWESLIEDRRNAFVRDLPSIQDEMLEIFKSAEDIVAGQETRFRALFPDLPSDIPVYFMLSLGAFNGQVRQVQGHAKFPLLIGVDFVVQRQDPIDVLFAHEYFHAYHREKLANVQQGNTMATPLWKEGFATFISGILNPKADEALLLMDPVLAQACSDPKTLSRMAAQYLAVLSTDGSSSYTDWFTMSGSTKPTRRGYCLGLQVVRELSKTNDIKDLIKWGEDRWLPAIEMTLKKMATNDSH